MAEGKESNEEARKSLELQLLSSLGQSDESSEKRTIQLTPQADLLAEEWQQKQQQYHLVCQSNQLRSWPAFELLQSVSKIDFSDNQLTTIPDQISLLQALQVLNLSHNAIHIISDQISSLVKLEEANLSSNRIENVPLFSSSNLMLLDLSHNSIASLSNSFFSQIQLLESLDISFNNLTELPEGGAPFDSFDSFDSDPVYSTVEIFTGGLTLL